MGALGSGLDKASDLAVTGATYTTLLCSVFPPAFPLSKEMPRPAGGPGSMIEGAQGWLQGSAALHRAKSAVEQTATAIPSDVWTGDDRTAFDGKVSDLVSQLDIAATYADAVGAGLAGLSAPLLAVPPACVTMAGLLIIELVTFETAVASVVGNLGASEAAYAAGCATAASCLSVMSGITIGVTIAMSAAAAALAIGTGVDAAEQDEHGDTSAIGNYVKAEVVGLVEFGEDAAAGAIAGKVAGRATRGLPERNLEEYVMKDQLTKGLENRLGDVNSAATDLVKGNPGDALKDLSGYGDQIDAVEDLFGDDDPPNDHTEDRYSLPTPPPTPPADGPNIQPIPPATGPPEIHPIPFDETEDDETVIPVGADINGGRPA